MGQIHPGQIHPPETCKTVRREAGRPSGRGISIQSGLFSGSIGHDVDRALKVREFDNDGNENLHSSTLDEFESFWKPIVDFGLFGFAMANSSTDFTAAGSMTALVVLSLIIGKMLGIYYMYIAAKKLGFKAPLGIQKRHILMISLICSNGLIVAYFLADHAFPKHEALQNQAKSGSLLSLISSVLCISIGMLHNFEDEDVTVPLREQIREENELENSLRLCTCCCCTKYAIVLTKEPERKVHPEMESKDEEVDMSSLSSLEIAARQQILDEGHMSPPRLPSGGQLADEAKTEGPPIGLRKLQTFESTENLWARNDSNPSKVDDAEEVVMPPSDEEMLPQSKPSPSQSKEPRQFAPMSDEVFVPTGSLAISTPEPIRASHTLS